MMCSPKWSHGLQRGARWVPWLLAAGALGACTFTSSPVDGQPSPDPSEPSSAEDQARVLSVEGTGSEGAYTFAVTVSSPDTGCDRYADWWEVVSPDGKLLYRRVLLHSHVDEQPFTRTGGPVPVSSGQPLLVRAHMHPEGYSTLGLRGSVDEGFVSHQLPPTFAADLETVPPLPDDCAF